MIAHVGAMPWARTRHRPAAHQRRDQLHRLRADHRAAGGRVERDHRPPTTARPADWDTEVMPQLFLHEHAAPRGDGMPTWWETLRGFNPNVADNNVVTPEGYTRLEKYLHYLDAQANWNLNADGNWSQHMNWRGMRPETTRRAPANFVAGITAPRTVTIDVAGHRRPDELQQPGGVHAGRRQRAHGRRHQRHGAHRRLGRQPRHRRAARAGGRRRSSTSRPAGDTLTASNLQPTSARDHKSGAGTLAVNNVRAGGAGGQRRRRSAMLPNGARRGASKLATSRSRRRPSSTWPTTSWSSANPRGHVGTARPTPASPAWSTRGRNGGGVGRRQRHRHPDTRAIDNGDLTSIGVATRRDMRQGHRRHRHRHLRRADRPRLRHASRCSPGAATPTSTARSTSTTTARSTSTSSKSGTRLRLVQRRLQLRRQDQHRRLRDHRLQHRTAGRGVRRAARGAEGVAPVPEPAGLMPIGMPCSHWRCAAVANARFAETPPAVARPHWPGFASPSTSNSSDPETCGGLRPVSAVTRGAATGWATFYRVQARNK